MVTFKNTSNLMSALFRLLMLQQLLATANAKTLPLTPDLFTTLVSDSPVSVDFLQGFSNLLIANAAHNLPNSGVEDLTSSPYWLTDKIQDAAPESDVAPSGFFTDGLLHRFQNQQPQIAVAPVTLLGEEGVLFKNSAPTLLNSTTEYHLATLVPSSALPSQAANVSLSTTNLNLTHYTLAKIDSGNSIVNSDGNFVSVGDWNNNNLPDLLLTRTGKGCVAFDIPTTPGIHSLSQNPLVCFNQWLSPFQVAKLVNTTLIVQQSNQFFLFPGDGAYAQLNSQSLASLRQNTNYTEVTCNANESCNSRFWNIIDPNGDDPLLAVRVSQGNTVDSALYVMSLRNVTQNYPNTAVTFSNLHQTGEAVKITSTANYASLPGNPGFPTFAGRGPGGVLTEYMLGGTPSLIIGQPLPGHEQLAIFSMDVIRAALGAQNASLYADESADIIFNAANINFVPNDGPLVAGTSNGAHQDLIAKIGTKALVLSGARLAELIAQFTFSASPSIPPSLSITPSTSATATPSFSITPSTSLSATIASSDPADKSLTLGRIILLAVLLGLTPLLVCGVSYSAYQAFCNITVPATTRQPETPIARAIALYPHGRSFLSADDTATVAERVDSNRTYDERPSIITTGRASITESEPAPAADFVHMEAPPVKPADEPPASSSSNSSAAADANESDEGASSSPQTSPTDAPQDDSPASSSAEAHDSQPTPAPESAALEEPDQGQVAQRVAALSGHLFAPAPQTAEQTEGRPRKPASRF